MEYLAELSLLAIRVKHEVPVRKGALLYKACWGVYEQNSIVNSRPCR